MGTTSDHRECKRENPTLGSHPAVNKPYVAGKFDDFLTLCIARPRRRLDGRVKDVMQDASMWAVNPHTPASRKAVAIAQEVLQGLLNDPKIVEALK